MGIIARMFMLGILLIPAAGFLSYYTKSGEDVHGIVGTVLVCIALLSFLIPSKRG